MLMMMMIDYADDDDDDVCTTIRLNAVQLRLRARENEAKPCIYSFTCS